MTERWPTWQQSAQTYVSCCYGRNHRTVRSGPLKNRQGPPVRGTCGHLPHQLCNFRVTQSDPVRSAVAPRSSMRRQSMARTVSKTSCKCSKGPEIPRSTTMFFYAAAVGIAANMDEGVSYLNGSKHKRWTSWCLKNTCRSS